MVNVDWFTFILKLVLVPVFIAAVSLVGRRWGTTVGGWLVGLPLTSGPVAFFLALEQGSVFAYQASGAIMLGIVSFYAFCLAYGWSAMRFGWFLSAFAGIVAFLAGTFLLEMTTLSLAIELALAVLVLILSLYLMPRVGRDRKAKGHMRWELPARMISATALVFLITGVASLLGPELTGLLSPFPVYATTLSAFIHRSQGGEEAVKFLRGVMVGSFTFIIFFLILSLTLVSWGIAASFLTAVIVSLLTHGASLQLLRFSSRIAEPPSSVS